MPLTMTAKQANALQGNIDNPVPKRARKPQVRSNDLLEKDIQRLIVSWFRKAKKEYVVKQVGQYIAKPDRPVNDEAYPDLSIRKIVWPQSMACLMEVKVPETGRLSKAQKEFFDQGGSFVVHSLEEAQAAIKDFEALWRAVE